MNENHGDGISLLKAIGGRWLLPLAPSPSSECTGVARFREISPTALYFLTLRGGQKIGYGKRKCAIGMTLLLMATWSIWATFYMLMATLGCKDVATLSCIGARSGCCRCCMAEDVGMRANVCYRCISQPPRVFIL